MGKAPATEQEVSNEQLVELIRAAAGGPGPSSNQTVRVALGVLIGMLLWSVGASLVAGVVAFAIVDQDVALIPAAAIGAALCLVLAFLAYAFAPLDDVS